MHKMTSSLKAPAKQIAYVLATNYSGSHFLALQMGSHPRCASIGEPHHFRKATWQKACHLCESDDACPVFKGVLELPTDRFYSKIFENLSEYAPQTETLIDNSKKTRWTKLFLNADEYEKKYIHLIRDPRALVRRWLINYEDPAIKRKIRLKTARRCWQNAREILGGDEIQVFIWHWLSQNRRITDFLSKNRLDHKLVTYHDLVFNPDEVLSDLMTWLGYDYDPAQKEYWNFTHHSSVKSEYIKPPSSPEKIFDQRWKSFLTQEAQEKILNHPELRSYIDSLGLLFDPEKGLTNPNHAGITMGNISQEKPPKTIISP